MFGTFWKSNLCGVCAGGNSGGGGNDVEADCADSPVLGVAGDPLRATWLDPWVAETGVGGIDAALGGVPLVWVVCKGGAVHFHVAYTLRNSRKASDGLTSVRWLAIVNRRSALS